MNATFVYGRHFGQDTRRCTTISDDSQLTVENFGGSQERLHFAGRHPAKELATVGPQRKISAPAGKWIELFTAM
ncbi:hypothetical protein JYU34_002192 [Plutella xylostella]|uniref:Uncharacterized protein n=1 Tax=Plutella xylostella TaxID=51655 RepID=A0ABQ7R1R5_PLUXY|nr:hypothetical protein JYU34_002192 [Plutella xylostella]